MRLKTMTYGLYGGNKLPVEKAEKKQIRAIKRMEKAQRAMTRKPPRFVPGMRIGMLELVDRDVQPGYFQPFHGGRWRAICHCGRKDCRGVRARKGDRKFVVVEYWRLNQGKAYSCGAVKNPEMGRPPLNLAGKTFGRLLAVRYEKGRGWLCECGECGGRLWVRYSHQLEKLGRTVCEDLCRE